MGDPRRLDRLAPWLVAAATALLRLATLAPDVGGLSADTGNYLLAMQSFSLELGRPHLPGSWLLVVLLRGLEPWFGAHGALLALAVGCSAAGAGLSYALARRWFTAAEAGPLTAVLVTQPLVWFHGVVPEIYAFDLFFAALVARLGLSRRGLFALPVVFALGAGLRLTTPVLLAPLYAWLWRDARRLGRWRLRGFWLAHLAGAAVLAAVLQPLVASAGGPGAYAALWRTHQTIDWSLARNLWGLTLFTATLGATALALILAGAGWSQPGLDRRARHLLLVWLLPPAAFFVLGHYQKGYALLVAAPLVLLLASRIAAERRRAVLTCLALAQAVFFLGAPYREPGLQIWLAPDVRTASLAEVWWQRARSTHLAAATMPRAMAAASAELAAVLGAAPEDTVLVDPTFPLPLRALQVRHPGRAFAALDLHRPDGWRLHAGPAETTGSGVAALLPGTLILTRRDLAEAELVPLGAEVYREGRTYAALRVSAGQAAAVARRYAELFAR